jgi:Acetoacetate decarboxylase (ADC)
LRLVGAVADLGAAGYAGAIRLLNGSGDAGLAQHPDSVSCVANGRRQEVTLPIRYTRADVFMAIFPARYRWVRGRLPAGLWPLWLGRDRAPIAVAAFNYLEASIDPYGEVAILVPCTRGPAAPGAVVTAMESLYPGFGFFVMHLPVTSELADVLGVEVWGYPKFIADIRFRRGRDDQAVHLGEGGRTILELTVEQRGVRIRDDRPFATYSTKGTRLIHTTMPTQKVYQAHPGSATASLVLGDHPISAELRALGISPRPLYSLNFLSFAAALPRGRTVGRVGGPWSSPTSTPSPAGRGASSSAPLCDGQASH